MKRKSMITMLVIALMLVLSLTVLSACGKKMYQLTVTGGTGGGEYSAGTVITITADTPETGKKFTGWTLDGVSVDDKTEAELTFTMPESNVTATANYEYIDYAVTVTGGTANKTTAHYGDSVTITAAAPETGKEFTSWTINGVSVDDKTKTEITFTMPANAVIATANYGDVLYEFALENCTADKESAKFGEQVTFTADVFEDKRFVGWSVKGVDETGLDLTKSPLTITMPANDINVAAQLEQLYKITIAEGCTTDKEWAAAGEKVTVKQPTPPEGHLYTWKFEGVKIPGAQISQPEVTFTMPENDVNITVVLGVVDFFVSIEGGTIEYGDQILEDEAQVRYGTDVTIKANAPTGMRFTGWTIEGVTVENTSVAELTFTMPAGNVTATANYEFIDYTVSVTGGKAKVNGGVASASVKAHYGDKISIMAEIPTGMIFKGWTLEGVMAETGGFSINFTMPANNVTATAKYVYNNYTVTVVGGTADKTTAHYGDSITITAAAPETGKRFTSWTIEGVTVENTSVTELTFTMPAGNVKATANYDFIDFTVTVVGGTADKATAHYGEEVTITANEPGTNKEFIGWNSPDGVVFNNNTSIETTFIMPASNVTVNAVFGDINKYSVLVNYDAGGAAADSQTAYCGDPVTITAKNIEGKIFVRWEITGLDTEGLDLTKSPLAFTMPENNVTANAIYEDLITLTFEGSTAQSEPLTYRKGASKTFRIELGDSQELCEYDISLTNKSCTFKVYDSIGNEIEPTDNGDGSMRIAINRQDTYTIRVTYEGTNSTIKCAIKITASSPTV